MRLLFIAPLPPPIGGHSYVSKVALDGFIGNGHEVDIININKLSMNDGSLTLSRISSVLMLLMKIMLLKKNHDRIYITISESLLGNIKDLFIYLILYRNINNFYIHLHGGSIGINIFNRYPILKNVNKYFISRVSRVIISGESHANIFCGLIKRDKISIIPNFAGDEFFQDARLIPLKYKKRTIKILFLSNMIEGKGYLDLAEAFICLPQQIRKMFTLTFAGRFEDLISRNTFLNIIREAPEITYAGVVDSEVKKDLLFSAQVFCLPTKLNEGQPISILEAYSSGCIVLTSPKPGILDIFEDNVNGYILGENLKESLSKVLLKILNKSNEDLSLIGLLNYNLATEKYKMIRFTTKLNTTILEECKDG